MYSSDNTYAQLLMVEESYFKLILFWVKCQRLTSGNYNNVKLMKTFKCNAKRDVFSVSKEKA